MRTIGNILWLVLAGFWLALVPFGKTLVDADGIGGRDVYLRGPEPIR